MTIEVLDINSVLTMGRNHKRSHEEVRVSLCGLCYGRGELRSISDDQLAQLQQLVYPSYSLSDPRFQRVLCRNCALVLNAHTKNPENPGRKLFIPCYGNMAAPPTYSTRTIDEQVKKSQQHEIIAQLSPLLYFR